jgi:antitoxin MazE
LDIKKWGNSLGMRLPTAVAKAAHLHLDQKVSLSVEHGKVIISPVENKFITLDQRLSQFNPKTHGKEAMQTDELIGDEWGDENYCDTLFIAHGTTTIEAPYGTTAYYDEN